MKTKLINRLNELEILISRDSQTIEECLYAYPTTKETKCNELIMHLNRSGFKLEEINHFIQYEVPKILEKNKTRRFDDK